MASKLVRVAVVGDEGVGKSALVSAAVHNIFAESPPPTLPPTRLPSETVESYMSPAPPTLLIDTCSRSEEKQAWELSVLEANVIVLAFAANDLESLRRVAMHWIPELERVGVHTPIILTACKSDLANVREEQISSLIQAILTEFKHIETFLESSAKKHHSVNDVFYYAIKSVMHPAEPLVNFDSAALQPLCIKALKRVFLLCDEDKDGALSDAELNKFQVKCFNAPLQPTELAGVKEVVGERLAGGLDKDRLTLKGFLFLHALFIEKARTETVWTVLRAFGYSDELLIEPRWLDAVDFNHQPDQVVELSLEGRRFLQKVFDGFARNDDLSKAEQDDMFSASPSSAFDDPEVQSVMVQTTRDGLTRAGFLSKWAYLTAANPRAALTQMLYLGMKLNADVMQHHFSISRPRHVERKKARDSQCRTFFQCFVFGGSDAAKSQLLEGLLRQQSGQAAEPSQQGSSENAPVSRVAVNEVVVSREQRGRQHQVSATLVLREMQQQQLQDLDSSPADFLQLCDMAALLFQGHSMESFLAARELLIKLSALASDSLPCVMVASVDQAGVSQDVQEAVVELSQEMSLQAPEHVTAHSHNGSLVYSTIVDAALRPVKYIPETAAVKARREHDAISNRSILLVAASAAAVLGLYSLWRYSSNETGVEDLKGSTKSSKGGFGEHVKSAKATFNGLLQSFSRG